ncbi:MAG TPA: hypothetical protein VIL31_02525 [Cyclobacteriaceae bacterium]
MTSKALRQLRLQASGSLRWICCIVLLILMLLRFWGPLNYSSESVFGEQALRTERMPYYGAP